MSNSVVGAKATVGISRRLLAVVAVRAEPGLNSVGDEEDGEHAGSDESLHEVSPEC